MKLEESVVRIPRSIIGKSPEQFDERRIDQIRGETRRRSLFQTRARFRPRELNRILLRELRNPRSS